jgi:hypothetical protein
MGRKRYSTTPGEEEQREHCSGKKAHKIKNVALVSKAGRVLFLSHNYEGSRHDKVIVTEEGCQFHVGIILHQDLGYPGTRPVR